MNNQILENIAEMILESDDTEFETRLETFTDWIRDARQRALGKNN